MRCRECNVDPAEFYNGVPQRCKECHKKKVSQNRQANLDYYRAYDAARFQSDPEVKKRHRLYQQTDNGKASMQASQERWLARNPEKRSVHLVVSVAVRAGRLVKPNNCLTCGSVGRVHAHHKDYSKPLEVDWLCTFCHRAEHLGAS